MKVQVQLFADARDRVGSDSVDVTLSENATIADLRTALSNEYPTLQPIAGHLLFAMNDDYGTDETPIQANARLACFPPVSGG